MYRLASVGTQALRSGKVVVDLAAPSLQSCATSIRSYHHDDSYLKDPNIVRSKVLDYDPKVNGTFSEVMRSMVTRWENDVAYECLETGVKFTHKEVFDYSRNFAAALHQAGLRKGNVVGLAMTNSPYFPIAFFGIIEAGMTANLLTPTLPAARLTQMIHDSKTRAVVAAPESAATFQAIKASPEARRVKFVVSGKDVKGCHDINEMMKTNSKGVNLPTIRDIDVQKDVPILYWSSGTTGPPKAVLTSYPHLKSQMQQWVHPEFGSYKHGDVTIAALPFYHAYGNIAQIRVAHAVGMKVLTMPKFERNAFAAAIQKYKPSVINGIPTLVELAATHPSLTRESFSRMHTFTNGAYVVPVKVLESFFDRAGKHVFVQDLYGTSEAGMTHAVPQAYKNMKYGSIGRLLPFQLAKIVDDKGKTLGIGEKGELLIKGPQLMKGYLNNETATREALDSDGWSHTGDVAYYDKDRFFYIAGRTKDMIKYKGSQVSPVLLQDILNRHPKIRDSAVVGIPQKKVGELPRAYIVLENKRDPISVEEINAYLQDKVMAHEKLRGGIEFVKEIPKCPVGKIQRKELVQRYLDSQRK